MAITESVQTESSVSADLMLPTLPSNLPVKTEATSDATPGPVAVTNTKDQAAGACSSAQPISVNERSSTTESEPGLKDKDVVDVSSRNTIAYRCRTFMAALLKIFWIWVKLLLSFLTECVGAVMLLLSVSIFVCLPIAVVSVFGSVSMLTGNGVLRALGYVAHSIDGASPAAIGALGAFVTALVLFVFLIIMARLATSPSIMEPSLTVIAIAFVAVVALSGVVGSSIFLSFRTDMGSIDVITKSGQKI